MHAPSVLRHTISLQAAWEPAASGRAGWARRFGRPLELPPGERLVLVIEPAAGPPGVEAARAELNGVPLAGLPAAEALAARDERPPGEPPAAAAFARDVTAAVVARNELFLAVDPTTPPTDGTGRHRRLPTEVARVWLEVQATPAGSGAIDHP